LAIAASCSVTGPAPRVVVLLAIAVSCSAVGHRHELQRCWPLLQQRAATRCQLRHNSELQRSAGLAIAASCNALLASRQRCVARSCSAASPPAITTATIELCSSDVRPTYIRRLSDFHSTSVQLPSDICPTSVPLPSDVRPTSVRWSYVLLS
jgi:hypothetical protein